MSKDRKQFITENFMMNESFGIIVDTEIPALSEQFGVSAATIKRDLKALNCVIYKTRPKPLKDPEKYADEVNALKIRKNRNLPPYLQKKSVRLLIGAGVWQKVRQTVLEQNGQCCTVCGYTTDTLKKLHVHEEWKTDEKELLIHLTGLSLLCLMCHSLQHWHHTYFRTARTGEWPEVQRKLNLHFMQVNQCSQEIMIAADQLAARERFIGPTTPVPDAIEQRALMNADWTYSIFDEMPYREEVRFHLRKKVKVLP